MVTRKARPLTIECVARGYIAGSLFKEYRKEGGQVHGLDLPDGLHDGSRLPEPIFTPATKAEEGHDENISFAQAADMVGREVAEQARDWTLMLYSRAAEHAEKAGVAALMELQNRRRGLAVATVLIIGFLITLWAKIRRLPPPTFADSGPGA